MYLAAFCSIFGGILLFCALRVWRLRKSRNPCGLPYPPRPKPKFLVGNLGDIPRGNNEWLEYMRMSEELGADIVYYQVLGKNILVLNSFQAANDLLDKRSAVFSDRPRLPLLKELKGWDWNLLVMSYHEGFATHRRLVQQSFQPSVVTKDHHPVMQREVLVLLRNLLEQPIDFVPHLKRMAGAIIMMVTYGYEVAPKDDKFVRLAEEIRDLGSKTPSLSALVDFMPALKYLPTWFPGASFHRLARHSTKLSTMMREAPFQMVKERLANGTAQPSLVSSLLDRAVSGEDIDDALIKNCGGVVYSAGADTTASALTNAMLALMRYPDVQERAHRELDQVIGRDRLPAFEDRSKLPYIGALLKEVLRWKVVTPLGVPHCTTQDEVYRGTFIPERTIVIANLHAMLHDKTIYEDPDRFEPERHLLQEDDSASDSFRMSFGFGRRICPGRYFAEDSIWLALASILQVFQISKLVDATGRPIDTHVTWTSGLVSNASPFTCNITTRFPGAESLLVDVD
ncbi:cytochrome P450 [Auriscalpium vulgare]|uniref:Cytochrome P450 n=1 Tax=Auriscalpium vulgare TaxID=40419 RepID=A0ACB8RV63_9AGAM|nr:cytochrome P450 [Auriscalpium vulgare]